MPTIQPFHHRKKKQKLTLELDFELAETLKAYSSYYRETYGADVQVSDLTLELMRQFAAGDHEFQRHRAKAGKATGGVAASTQ